MDAGTKCWLACLLLHFTFFKPWGEYSCTGAAASTLHVPNSAQTPKIISVLFLPNIIDQRTNIDFLFSNQNEQRIKPIRVCSIMVRQYGISHNKAVTIIQNIGHLLWCTRSTATEMILESPWHYEDSSQTISLINTFDLSVLGNCELSLIFFNWNIFP